MISLSPFINSLFGTGEEAKKADPEQNDEEKYAVELGILSDMGFGDKSITLPLIQMHDGSLEDVLEVLLH